VAELRDLVQGIRRAADDGRGPAGDEDAPGGGDGRAAGDGETPPLPLPEIMAAAEQRFEAAAGSRDADAMVGVILELETAIGQWEADMDEDQGTEQARALLRSLVGRLGRAAQDGLTDPRDRLRPAVEPLLDLRATLRNAGNFAAADAIREALTAAGFDVSDTPDGTRWQPAATARSADA
jgi:cysteinyl-tRNA synthetase